MVFPTIIANLLATGCALLLVKRGPTRRLKLLSLTVGLISLTQTAIALQSGQNCSPASSPTYAMHQVLTGTLSLLAIFLLGLEIFDRARTDRKLRLAEYAAMVPKPKAAQRSTPITDLPDLSKLSPATDVTRQNA